MLVVAPALPSVVGELGGLPLYPWVFAAYLLAATATTPVYGRVADVYGPKRPYLVGVGLFLAGSALAGTADSMGFLVAMRGLQGLGAGALVPITLTLVGELYPFERRARLQGVVSSVWGLAAVVGPPVGGLLVTHAGWRWVFYLNVPFGLAATWLVKRHLEEKPRAASATRQLDVTGAVALMVGLGSALLGLQAVGQEGAVGPALAAGLLAAAALALFVHRERRAIEPLVDRGLLRNPIFLAASAGGLFGFAVLYATTAYVPLLVRSVLGGSPQAAGFVLMPLSLSWVAASVAAGHIILHAGYRSTTGLGVLLIAAGCAGLATLDTSARMAQLYVTMMALGAGMGLAMTGFLVAVQSAAPPGRMGMATSAVQFFRSLGGALGVALLGFVLMAGLREQGVDPAQAAQGAAGGSGGLAAVPAGALMSALHLVFVATLACAAGTVAAGLAMPGGGARRHIHPARR